MEERKKVGLNCLVQFLFAVYLILLVWIILFKLQLSIHELDRIRGKERNGWQCEAMWNSFITSFLFKPWKDCWKNCGRTNNCPHCAGLSRKC